MGEEESIGLDSPKVRAFRGRWLPARPLSRRLRSAWRIDARQRRALREDLPVDANLRPGRAQGL